MANLVVQELLYRNPQLDLAPLQELFRREKSALEQLVDGYIAHEMKGWGYAYTGFNRLRSIVGYGDKAALLASLLSTNSQEATQTCIKLQRYVQNYLMQHKTKTALPFAEDPTKQANFGSFFFTLADEHQTPQAVFVIAKIVSKWNAHHLLFLQSVHGNLPREMRLFYLACVCHHPSFLEGARSLSDDSPSIRLAWFKERMQALQPLQKNALLDALSHLLLDDCDLFVASRIIKLLIENASIVDPEEFVNFSTGACQILRKYPMVQYSALMDGFRRLCQKQHYAPEPFLSLLSIIDCTLFYPPCFGYTRYCDHPHIHKAIPILCDFSKTLGGGLFKANFLRDMLMRVCHLLVNDDESQIKGYLHEACEFYHRGKSLDIFASSLSQVDESEITTSFLFFQLRAAKSDPVAFGMLCQKVKSDRERASHFVAACKKWEQNPWRDPLVIFSEGD